MKTSKSSYAEREDYAQAKKTNNWKNVNFFQKECRRKIRQAEWQYLNNTIEEGMRNSNKKPFRRYVKARRQDNVGVAPLYEGSALHSDSKTKARILLEQFQSVFTKDDGAPLPQVNDKAGPTINDLVITTDGVAKLLRNINPAKATGPDNIPNQVLKTCANNIAPPFNPHLPALPQFRTTTH